MTRDECLRMAKLKGYSFEAACELATFIKPRLQFKTIEKNWREHQLWRHT